MKKTILALIAAVLTTAGAWATTTHMPRHTAQKANALVTPEGEMRYYEMSAYIYESIGLEHIEGLVNKVYISDDGKTAYIGSLFPNSFRTDDLWLKGDITPGPDGTQLITIDCKTPVFRAGWDEIYVGEVWFNEDTYETSVKDIVLIKDGDRIYIDDDVNNYSRCLVAYEDDYGDIETVDVAYCVDMHPYTGNTTAVEVPASASRNDYVYYSLDTYGALTAVKSTVAVDGDDYYFDTLLPNIAPAWVKGTRQGNVVTIPAGQFMGADCGYYLYSAAFRPTSYDEAEGQYIGTPCDITFSIGTDGALTFATPQPSFITALQNDGKQYDCVYENRIVPYTGDVPATPSDPTEVRWDDYTSSGAYALDFVLNNVSTTGEYLNPEKLGYYIYLNGERVTFTRDVYSAIHTDEMTLIPFGYTDAAGYDFYSAGGWNEVFIYVADFETLGVQAVYTVDGETRESNLINVTRDGDVEVIAPVGIAPLKTTMAESAADNIFDLYGRRTTNARGLRIENGRIIIR